jgi:hypothetical protein
MSSGESARRVVDGGRPIRVEPNRRQPVAGRAEPAAATVAPGGSGKSVREVINAGTPTRVSPPVSKGATS